MPPSQPRPRTQTRYIFVTGGVLSSLGKGIAAASLGALLQARGFSVRLRKLDPYLNFDAGTMSPSQHGEVFVTDDGMEADLDLGHYERFTGVSATKNDSITSGRIYSAVLAKERRGDYLGATVQLIPHVTDEIKAAIRADEGDQDFTIVELGGTIGDMEGLPFLEAFRQLAYELGRGNTLFVHVTLAPWIAAAGELKTKPTQHSVKDLLGLGIQPDILLVRCERNLQDAERRKIALFCNLLPERIIPAEDAYDIYAIPEALHSHGLDAEALRHFGLSAYQHPDLRKWQDIVRDFHHAFLDVPECRIGVVGKYVETKDAYKSLSEALKHGWLRNRACVAIEWIDADSITGPDDPRLAACDSILVPGGFGERGVQGKLAAIQHARETNKPFLGICFGMQLAVIETARHLADLPGASSTEFGPCKVPVVSLVTEWNSANGFHLRTARDDLGGTMRLGAQTTHLVPGSRAAAIYGDVDQIEERHRHRYEVNLKYRSALESAGLTFSGFSADGKLAEIIERVDHPWFVAVQFHPELKSRPFDPHPLFVSFVAAGLQKRVTPAVQCDAPGEDPSHLDMTWLSPGERGVYPSTDENNDHG